MSLDIQLLEWRKVTVFSTNFTHNAADMARHAGIYNALWGGDADTAEQLIRPLAIAIRDMEKNPDEYKKMEAKNGWGTYDQFLLWCKELLVACCDEPDAEISMSK